MPPPPRSTLFPYTNALPISWYEKVLPYRQLQRGDIIVFKYPYADHQHFVKRVIGLPGDRLKLIDGDVFIDRKSTRLNSSHQIISYAVFCLKKKTNLQNSAEK